MKKLVSRESLVLLHSGGLGRGAKPICVFEIIFKKDPGCSRILRFEEPTYQKNVLFWGIPSTSHAFIRKGLEVILALPFS